MDHGTKRKATLWHYVQRNKLRYPTISGWDESWLWESTLWMVFWAGIIFLHISEGTSTYENVVDSQALYTIET